MVHVEAVMMVMYRQYEDRVVHVEVIRVEAVMMVVYRDSTRTAWCMWRCCMWRL